MEKLDNLILQPSLKLEPTKNGTHKFKCIHKIKYNMMMFNYIVAKSDTQKLEPTKKNGTHKFKWIHKIKYMIMLYYKVAKIDTCI